MNLPNYFLADLPPEAVLTGQIIADACQTLKRNRETYLARRSTSNLVRVISEVAQCWRQSEYPFRKLALKLGPDASGFSEATIASGLDAFFSELTAEKLQALLEQELGHTDRLDQMVATSVEERAQRAALAIGPELIAHVAAGNLPNPVLTAMVLGLLTRSAQFVKCGTGATLLPRLFAHSIYEVEPKLGACIEIAAWKGGTLDLEDALFHEADCVLATGADETIASIGKRIAPHKRFLGYGQRLSFGYITHEMLSSFNTATLIRNAARDVAMWDQAGCLSPHLFYAEFGGKLTPEGFAEKLAQELDRIESTEPRGALKNEEAGLIATRRAFYEIRAANLDTTRHWWSKGSTAWSVVYEADPLFQVSCLNRFIYVKGVSSLTDAMRGADSVRSKISTVGLAATENRAQEIAHQLARWGVTRICPVGKMQQPPLTWRHDGRPSLGDLVKWADWEV